MISDLDPWLQYIKFVKKIEHRILPKIIIKPKNIEPINNSIRKELLNSLKIPILPPTISKKRNPPVTVGATLDLHGLTQAQAFLELNKCLEQAYYYNKKHILIITGKGPLDKPGIIKLIVPRWLQYTELNKYIQSYSTAKNHLGGEGAILVAIKNKA